MVTSETGQTALKYYQPQPVIVRNTPTKKEYAFAVKASISMAWIDESDVDSILNRKAGCNCGGSRRQAFKYASEDDVRRWQNGGGR